MADTYTCESCNHNFCDRRSLNRHTQTYNGECKKQTAKFTCAQCNEKFASKYSMLRHQKRAHAETQQNINVNIGEINGNGNTINNNSGNITINIEINSFDIPSDISGDITRLAFTKNDIIRQFIKGDRSRNANEVTGLVMADIIELLQCADTKERNIKQNAGEQHELQIYQKDRGWIGKPTAFVLENVLRKTSNGLREVDNLQPCEHAAATLFANTHDNNTTEVTQHAKPYILSHAKNMSKVIQEPEINIREMLDKHEHTCTCESCPPRPIWDDGPPVKLTQADLAVMNERKNISNYYAFTTTLNEHPPRSLRKKNGKFDKWTGTEWVHIDVNAVLITLANTLGFVVNPSEYDAQYVSLRSRLMKLSDWQDTWIGA